MKAAEKSAAFLYLITYTFAFIHRFEIPSRSLKKYAPDLPCELAKIINIGPRINKKDR